MGNNAVKDTENTGFECQLYLIICRVMKNVIYINCYADPWLKVAQRLYDEYSYNPVYWVGYRTDDHSDESVVKSFPGIIYQDYIDGFRGVFPDIVDEWMPNYYIDIDFLRQYSTYELQAMTMMDRLDPDQSSFNFMERQRHYRNLLKRWSAVIDKLKIELVIATVSPHRVYDYALYNLCKYKKIPYIILEHTAFNGRFTILDNIFSINNTFVDDYKRLEKEKDCYTSISEDIKNEFERVKGDYNSAAPYWMRVESKNEKKYSNVIKLAFEYMRSKSIRNFFGKDGILDVGSGKYYKKKKYTLEQSRFSSLQFFNLKRRTIGIVDELKKHYDSLAVLPNYSEKYVIVFFHYQPEDTTSPCGDIFVNQNMCVEVLLKYLPDDCFIYVKEHPHQFLHHLQGSSCRTKEFYSDLIKNKRVKLISTNVNSFDLIDHSLAVTTITGTVGWESVVRRKPVILFGIYWIENYKGVLRIKDEKSAAQIWSFIQNYRYDEHSLHAYLAAVGANTYRAYYYMAIHKDELGISEQQCLGNIVNALIKKIKEIETI